MVAIRFVVQTYEQTRRRCGLCRWEEERRRGGEEEACEVLYGVQYYVQLWSGVTGEARKKRRMRTRIHRVQSTSTGREYEVGVHAQQ